MTCLIPGSRSHYYSFMFYTIRLQNIKRINKLYILSQIHCFGTSMCCHSMSLVYINFCFSKIDTYIITVDKIVSEDI